MVLSVTLQTFLLDLFLYSQTSGGTNHRELLVELDSFPRLDLVVETEVVDLRVTTDGVDTEVFVLRVRLAIDVATDGVVIDLCVRVTIDVATDGVDIELRVRLATDVATDRVDTEVFGTILEVDFLGDCKTSASSRFSTSTNLHVTYTYNIQYYTATCTLYVYVHVHVRTYKSLYVPCIKYVAVNMYLIHVRT